MVHLFGVLALIIISSVTADIPDEILDWRALDVVHHPGSDIIIDCMRTADWSEFHAVVFNGEYPERWSWYLVTLNRYGRETARTMLMENTGSMANWVTPAFISEDLLAVAHGPRIESGPASLTIISLATLETVKSIDISQCFPQYSDVDLTSIEGLESGSILIAGAGLTEENSTALFAAELSLDGAVLWQSEIYEQVDLVIESTSLKVLEDGSIMLSFEADGFPAGIPVYRLDRSGTEMWQTFIDLQCEFTARCSGFLEMRSGDILMTGYYDEMQSAAYRGLVISMDRSLSVLRERTDWYGDHTSFNSLQNTEDGNIMISGWTAENGDMFFQTVDMDVLLVFMEKDGSGIEGWQVTAQGSQRPAYVFPGGIGEYIILGEHIEDGEEDSDIFFGRIMIER